MTVEKITRLISKPSDERGVIEIELAIPLLRKHCEVFRDLDRGLVHDILKNCHCQQSVRDDVIVQQGDRGAFMYVIMTGRASVYIDNFIVDGFLQPEENLSARGPSESLPGRSLDRSMYGQYIITFEAGKRFGEMALMAKESTRNATIITDQTTNLLVIDKDLFTRTLLPNEAREFQARKDFINTNPLFGRWSPQLKRLVEMSLRKETFSFNNVVVKQGEPVRGVFFIRSGQVKLEVNSSLHYRQYPRVFGEVETKVKPRHVNRDGISLSCLQDHIRVRRKEGYAASEQRHMTRTENICCLQDNEVLSDIECVLGLDTYLYTAVSIAHTELYLLETKNFDRFIARKRHKAGDKLKFIVLNKIMRRIETRDIPIMPHLAVKIRAMIPKGNNRWKTEIQSFTDSPPSKPDEPGKEHYSRTKTDKVSSARGRSSAQALASRALHPRSVRLLTNVDLSSYREPRSIKRIKSADNRNLARFAQKWRMATSRPRTAPAATQSDTGTKQLPSSPSEKHVTQGRTVAFKAAHYSRNPDNNLAATMASYRAVLDAFQAVKIHRTKPDASADPQTTALPSSPDGVYNHDSDVSDEALGQLETKMTSFYHRLNGREKTKMLHPSYKLRPFRLQHGEQPPTPGGRVLVRTRPCKEPISRHPGSASHAHVRRFVLSQSRNFVLRSHTTL